MASQECDEGGADGWEEKRESDRRMEWVTGGHRGTMWLRAYVMLLLVYEVAVVGEAVDVIVFGISVQAVLKIVVNEKKTVFVVVVDGHSCSCCDQCDSERHGGRVVAEWLKVDIVVIGNVVVVVMGVTSIVVTVLAVVVELSHQPAS